MLYILCVLADFITMQLSPWTLAFYKYFTIFYYYVFLLLLLDFGGWTFKTNNYRWIFDFGDCTSREITQFERFYFPKAKDPSNIDEACQHWKSFFMDVCDKHCLIVCR